MKYKIIVFFLICLFGICYGVLGSRNYQTRIPISPDESQALFFSKHLSDNGSLIYVNKLNHEFSPPIFASRQYIQKGEDTVPSSFLGYIIILTLFRLVSEESVFVAGAILAIFCLVYFYKLTKMLLDEKTGLIAVFLLGIFPPFIYWTVSFYGNLAELGFLLAGIYYLIRLARRGSLSDYILTALLFSLAIWQRYIDILLIIPAVSCYLFIHRRKINLKYLITSLLVSLFLLLPILILNRQLYGSFFLFGQNHKAQLVYPYIEPGVPDEKFPFLPFRSFDILQKNSSLYLINFVPILFLLGILGLVTIWKRVNEARSELFLLLMLSITWIVYYLGGYYSGYGSAPLLNSSYTRYLLIFYALLILVASGFLGRIKKPGVILLITLATSATFMNILINSRYSLPALNAQIDGANSWLNEMKQVIPKNSVIFVKAADKTLFPSRNTALYQSLVTDSDSPEEAVDKTLNLMRNVAQHGYPVFFLKEDHYPIGYDSSEYISRLDDYGLMTKNYYERLLLYEIDIK